VPPVAPPFILGWEEWVALPEIGLPAIKAKVDTGARTSALHAFFVERIASRRGPRVRFGVHPIPRRADVAIICTAPVVDQRMVTSSNGERENRFVISTPIRIGEREWEIEVTLTNRDAMSYRMLLGRQAIGGGILVDPAASFRQPRLRYKLYEDTARS
jgi:ribosomal protein S6--L-glutamate ligase